MRRKTSLVELARVTGLPVARLRDARKGRSLGDAKTLAASLGVHVQTVRRWARSGVPESRVAAVAQIAVDRIAFERATKSEQRKVERLLTDARKRGVLPKAPPRGKSRFGGPRAAGERTVTHLNQYLSTDVLSEIAKQVKGAPKAERYIVTAGAVEAGITGKRRGYGGTITKKLGKEAENIQFGSAITSGSWTSKGKAIEALFAKLKDAIGDSDSLIYLTDLVVYSYEYKDTEKARKLIAIRQRGRR